MPTVPSLYTGWSPPVEPVEPLVPVELPPHPATIARMRDSAAKRANATTRRLRLPELFMSASSMRRRPRRCTASPQDPCRAVTY